MVTFEQLQGILDAVVGWRRIRTATRCGTIAASAAGELMFTGGPMEMRVGRGEIICLATPIFPYTQPFATELWYFKGEAAISDLVDVNFFFFHCHLLQVLAPMYLWRDTTLFLAARPDRQYLEHIRAQIRRKKECKKNLLLFLLMGGCRSPMSTSRPYEESFATLLEQLECSSKHEQINSSTVEKFNQVVRSMVIKLVHHDWHWTSNDIDEITNNAVGKTIEKAMLGKVRTTLLAAAGAEVQTAVNDYAGSNQYADRITINGKRVRKKVDLTPLDNENLIHTKEFTTSITNESVSHLPEESLLQKERNAQLNNGLNKCTDIQRIVLQRYVIENEPYAAISEETGISIVALKQQKSRAIVKLKKNISPYFNSKSNTSD